MNDGPVLTEEEVRAASGGYRLAPAQLKALHARGYWRAYRSPLTGRVVLERPHFLAVASGADKPKAPAPQLRLVTR